MKFKGLNVFSLKTILIAGIECGYSTISLPSKKQKLKIKHENNLSSR